MFLDDVATDIIKNPKTLDVRKFVGKRVVYLLSGDIDRSGRGIFFPRYADVVKVEKQNVWVDSDVLFLPQIVEIGLPKG